MVYSEVRRIQEGNKQAGKTCGPLALKVPNCARLASIPSADLGRPDTELPVCRGCWFSSLAPLYAAGVLSPTEQGCIFHSPLMASGESEAPVRASTFPAVTGHRATIPVLLLP